MISVTTQEAMLAAVLFAIHVFVPPAAQAQTAATTTATTPGEVREEVVTPSEALAWSLGSTLGGIALGIGIGVSGYAFDTSTTGDVLRGTGAVIGVLALTVGPSVGAMRAGAWGNGVFHSLGRLALVGWGFGFVGLGIWVEAVTNTSWSNSAVGGPLVVLGVGAMLAVPVLAVIDIVKAPGVARDQMREKGLEPTTPSVSVAPIILRDGIGMALCLAF